MGNMADSSNFRTSTNRGGVVSPEETFSGNKRGRDEDGDDGDKRGDEDNNENQIKELINKELASDDLEIVENALGELAYLFVDWSLHPDEIVYADTQGKKKATPNAKLFHELYGPGILLHFLNKYQNRVMLLLAALRALCNSLQLHVGLVLGSSLVELVLQTMKTHPDYCPIQCYGMGCLNNLYFHSPKDEKNNMAEIIVVKCNGFPMIEEASQHFCDCKEIHISAVRLIQQLAQIPELRNAIQEGDGLHVLARGMKALKDVDEEWYQKAKEALHLLTAA